MPKSGKRLLIRISIAGFAFMLALMGLFPLLQAFLDSKSGGAFACFFPCKDHMDPRLEMLNVLLTYFIALPVLLFFVALLWFKYFIFSILVLMLLYGLTAYIPRNNPLGNIAPDEDD